MATRRTVAAAAVEPEVDPLAFTQTAHSLVPANVNNLMSVSNERAKRTIVPISAADVTRAFLGPVTFSGGAYGDEIVTATANATDPYGPKTQAEKATYPGEPNSVVPSESTSGGAPVTVIPDHTFSTIVNSPRGWIDPDEPYGAAPVSPADDPTISSLTPNTGVSGGTPIWVTITGTKFTPYSTVNTGGVYTPYSKYFSPTKMAVLMDPRSSAGVVEVRVVDHGVVSEPANFTFT